MCPAAYYPEGHVPELHFMPLSYVCKGDVVHRKMCDYMAGQAVLLELQGGHSMGDWLPRHYHELLLSARERLVTEAKEDIIQQRFEDVSDATVALPDGPAAGPEAPQSPVPLCRTESVLS